MNRRTFLTSSAVMVGSGVLAVGATPVVLTPLTDEQVQLTDEQVQLTDEQVQAEMDALLAFVASKAKSLYNNGGWHLFSRMLVMPDSFIRLPKQAQRAELGRQARKDTLYPDNYKWDKYEVIGEVLKIEYTPYDPLDRRHGCPGHTLVRYLILGRRV